MNRSKASTQSKLKNPARFNKRALFEEKKTYKTDEGKTVSKWLESQIGSVWCQIRTIRGNEFLQGGAEKANIITRLNIRYRKDIEQHYYAKNEKLRINFDGRIFRIEYINNLNERNEEIELICREVR